LFCLFHGSNGAHRPPRKPCDMKRSSRRTSSASVSTRAAW
jgi:hypothetical protein